VAGQLNNFNKELQGKDKLITEVHNNIKAFEVEVRLWENQAKLHNTCHVQHLKSLDTMYPERIQEHSQSTLLFRKEFQYDCGS
jgi:hypothetical protein